MDDKAFRSVLALIFLTNLAGLALSDDVLAVSRGAPHTGIGHGANVSGPQVDASSERALAYSLAYMLGTSLGLAVVKNLNPNFKVRADAPQSFSEAQKLGRTFRVELPALPKYSGKLVTDTAAAIDYIFNQVIPLTKGAMDKNDESELDSAHFILGVIAPIAATFYDPRDSDHELAGTLINVLRQEGGKTGLPSNIWREPVELMESRAPTGRVSGSLQEMAPKVLKYYKIQ